MADFDAMQTFVAVMRDGQLPRRRAGAANPSVHREPAHRAPRGAARRAPPRAHDADGARHCGRSCILRPLRADPRRRRGGRARGHRGGPRAARRAPRRVVAALRARVPVADRRRVRAEVPARSRSRSSATNRRVNIVEEGFDLAVMFMDVNEDSSLVARKLESAEHRCCASPAYLAEHGAPRHPRTCARTRASSTARGVETDVALRARRRRPARRGPRADERQLVPHGPRRRRSAASASRRSRRSSAATISAPGASSRSSRIGSSTARRCASSTRAIDTSRRASGSS